MIFFLAFLCSESPLSKTESQTADIESKVQVSPKEKKLFDIKPKMEWSHKELKIEAKVEDVKPSCFEKGDLTEELSIKNKLLHKSISQLEKQVAEKDKQIDEKNDQIAEKDKQIADRDEQIVKHQLMYEEILQGKSTFYISNRYFSHSAVQCFFPSTE